MGTHSSYQLGCLSRVVGWKLVVTLLEVSEREECVVACHGHTLQLSAGLSGTEGQ